MNSVQTPAKTPPGKRGRLSLGAHLRETSRIAWPVVLGQLGYMVIGNADTIMIGQLGSTELAAATLANGVFALPLMLGYGVCVAISPITAQAVGGKKPREEFSKILHQGLLFAFYLATIMALSLLGITQILPHLGQDPEVVELATDYLLILTASCFPMLIFLIYKHFIEGFETTLPGMVMMWVMVVLNIFFNWLLIYGNWGLPEMGLEGAGWATLLARFGGMFSIIAFLHLSPRFRQYGNYLRRFWEHSREHLSEIARIGLPSGFMYFFEVGAFTGAVILAGRIGKEAQSAHNIAIQVAGVAFMFYLGLAHAAGIRVGNALGRGDRPEMRRAGLAGLVAGLICVVMFVILMVSFSKVIPGWYIDDAEVISITVPLLLITALFQLFDGIQGISAGILRGMSDVKIPTAITFIAYWMVGLPVAWLLGEYLEMGVNGIWFGLTAGLVLSAFALTARFLHKSRAR